MKRKKRRRKYNVKNILIFILLIVILIKGIGCSINRKSESMATSISKTQKQTTKKINYINKIENDDSFNGTIEEAIEKTIVEYMNMYFESITKLKHVDMISLFDKDSYEEAYINQTAIGILVDGRKLENNDMKISNAKYDIIYKKIKKENGKVTIDFLENDYLNFNYMKKIKSKAEGIENTIVLKKVNNKYKIVSFRKIQDFYVMFTNEYKTGKSNKNAKLKLDDMKDSYLYDYKQYVKDKNLMLKKYQQGKDKIVKKCDNKYNRNKALNYAKENVFKKNEKWMNYSEVGGNCQNFASQVIYSGGIPMDITGDYIWKHYDSKLDSTNKKIGRSSSWTTVPYFYEYAKNNEGYGLCAETDINLYYAMPGDIGQVGYNNEYRHTVVITGQIKNNKQEIVDLLINSNSLNLENYPLSGYVYPNKRIIKIIGWNEK